MWKIISRIKKCLPIPFRYRFKNVQCIIQKPSNPNTKPDGLISFVSIGYGGRTSDKTIVEESGFLEIVENGMFKII